MKLCQYGDRNREKPGLIDDEGRLRDLSHLRGAFTPEDLSPEGLSRLSAIDPRELPLVAGSPRLGVPYHGISKVVCIGLNYSDHAAETGLPIPSEPIIFLKSTSAICGPNDDTIQPHIRPSWTGRSNWAWSSVGPLATSAKATRSTMSPAIAW